MYSGFLNSFYKRNPHYKKLSFESQSEQILRETSEPIGSYTKMFNSMGIEASCVITNASLLQKRWRIENGLLSVTNDILVLEQVKKNKPDVLWIESLDYFEKKWVDLVRKSVPEIKLIIGSHCSPYSLKMLENFRNLDFVFTCTPGMKNEFEKNKLKTHLVYHAFDTNVLDRIKEDTDLLPVNDFIFTGSLFKGGGFHDKRIDFLESILKKNIDLKIYANLEKGYKTSAKQLIYYTLRLLNILKIDKFFKRLPFIAKHNIYSENLVATYSVKLKKAVHKPVFGLEMYSLLKKSKIVLNMHIDAAGDYAGNVRLFEATGVGSCLLTDNKKNLGELFDVNKEIVVYDGVDDCIEKTKWLLTHEEERKRIAESGQQRTLSSHTIEERCKKIIEIINSELRD